MSTMAGWGSNPWGLMLQPSRTPRVARGEDDGNAITPTHAGHPPLPLQPDSTRMARCRHCRCTPPVLPPLNVSHVCVWRRREVKNACGAPRHPSYGADCGRCETARTTSRFDTLPPCAATSSITGLLVGRAALCRMFVIATAGAQRYF